MMKLLTILYNIRISWYEVVSNIGNTPPRLCCCIDVPVWLQVPNVPKKKTQNGGRQGVRNHEDMP